MNVKKFTKSFALFLSLAVLFTGIPDAGIAGLRSVEAAERELADVNETSENEKDAATSSNEGKEKKKTTKSKKKLKKKKSKKSRKSKRNKKKDKKKDKKKNKKKNKNKKKKKKKIEKKTAVVVGPYIDGVYQGSARGYTDQVKVEVTVKDGNIVKVDIIEQKEDALYWAAAKKVADRIVESGKTQVDVSAGATISSKAIMYAVEDALKNAVRKKDEKKEEKKADTGWKDGYYKGTSGGFSGIVTSGVKIADSKIESVEVLSHTDDGPYMEVAKNLIKDMLKKQTPEVDVVSGATYSSYGIINSTKDALEQAKGNTKGPGESEFSKLNLEEHDSGLGGGSASPKQEIDFSGLQDGVYTGSASGYRSNSIEVKVTVQGGKITKIELIRNGDDASYFNNEKAKRLGDAIIAKQSSKVDVIAGATMSSRGFINSVVNALKQAGYHQKIFGNFDGKGNNIGIMEVVAKKARIKDAVITDRLIVSKEVGEGDIVFENLTIEGETLIEGGGENSIHFKGCKINGAVIVNKDGGNRVSISFENGTTNIKEVTLKSGALLSAHEGTEISKLVMPSTISHNDKIEVKAKVGRLDIRAEEADILIRAGSDITYVELPQTIENFEKGKKEYRSKKGGTGFVLTVEEPDNIKAGSNDNIIGTIKFLPKEEVKKLDSKQQYADGIYGGDATGFISNKPIPVEVEIKDGKIVAIRKLEDEIEKIAGGSANSRDIDDGEHYSWALKKLSDSIIKNQNPMEVYYKFNIMMQAVEAVIKEMKEESVEALRDALRTVLGKGDFEILKSFTDQGIRELSKDKLVFAVLTIVKNYLYDDLEYDRTEIDAVASATFSGKGSALAIGNAVKKSIDGVLVSDFKIEHKYKTDYTENDPIDFTGLTAQVKFKDKPGTVEIPYSKFEENGLKIINLEGNKEIKEGTLLNEENIGHRIIEGLSLKVIHENSDGFKFMKSIRIKPKTYLLKVDGVVIKAKGTDDWIKLKNFNSELQGKAPGRYLNFKQELKIRAEDYEKLKGKEIEFKFLTTDEESGEKKELVAKGETPLIGTDTPSNGYFLTIAPEELFDRTRKKKYSLDDIFTKNFVIHINKES